MRFLLLSSLLLLLAFAPDSASSAGARPPGGPFAAQWKKIDALLAKGQTATAAPLIECIYQQARRAQNPPNYLRALLYKVGLLEAKEENADAQAIALLEQDLRAATFPARPILHSLLAELYTNYLNQNRYRLYQRTPGATPSAANANSNPAAAGEATPTDLATWDIGRLGGAIVRHYYQSVEDEPQKQLQTTLAQLGDLAVGGDAEGRQLRPTLYDLLAQRAIAGLQNQELYLSRPAQQFELTEPQLFGPAAEFAALRLLAPEVDSLNGQLHALRLLQHLTASRQTLAPQNLAALADIDLQRLDYLRRLTENTALAAEYDPALARLAETYKALSLSTEFMARRAEARREADPVAAVALAREAEARFPKSRGAARARTLREQIQRPELAFSAAEVVVPQQPWRLDVTLRNVGELHAWAYRLTRVEFEQFGDYDERGRTPPQRYARALRAAPAATWAVPVPGRPLAYQEQKLAAAGPALPVGLYLVVISNRTADPAASKPGDVAVYAALQASELSALSRPEPADGGLNLLVLHRQSGAPLAGVRAQATFTRYDGSRNKEVRRLGPMLTTDARGQVGASAAAPGNSGNRIFENERLGRVRVWRGRDTLVLEHSGYHRPNRFQPQQAQRQTLLFTDRAIYRPGQTLYFKGIQTESRAGKARPLAAQPVSVRLVDVNGQTVQTLPFTTSGFGSFHGSIVLPTGLLNGEMSLQTDHGSLSFAVEDYKRPTFLVQLDSVGSRWPCRAAPAPTPGRPPTAPRSATA